MHRHMRFSPSSVIPEQMVATNPNMFIGDQYGKLPDLHGDGELVINEAIRLSKLINKFVPAFSGMDDRIICGFKIENVELIGNDLKISIGPGTGVIQRNVFYVPLRTDLVWKDFAVRLLPVQKETGKILIFFEYND